MTTSEICDAYGLEKLCLRIVDGASLRTLATEIGVSIGSLSNWIGADSERSARVGVARENAADTFADRAQEVLEDARANKVEIARAKELAHHFRWKASMSNPRRFGTKVELSGNIGLSNVTEEELDARDAALTAKIEAAELAAAKARTIGQ